MSYLWVGRWFSPRIERLSSPVGVRRAGRQVIRRPCQRIIPKVLVHLGWLRGLIYSSDKGSHGCHRTYVHFMETPPRLTCNPEGTQLYIIGGRYRVTPLGIEG